MIDDLRPCAQHGTPINRCAAWWPLQLAHLGYLCFKRFLARQKNEKGG